MIRFICLALVLAGATVTGAEAPRRLVMLKLDGVPAGLVEEGIAEHDPKTGISRLPWMEEVFKKHGTRIQNFYVRGISLSAPSWAMLDSGYHQRIHGNVEWDRYTLRVYDYLNFIPFYMNNGIGRRADTQGVEVLDANGVPLIADRFPWENRYQSFQLYQRWVRWKTLQRSFQNHFLLRSPRDVFDEWQTGLQLSGSIEQETERELLAHLKEPQYRYLDLYSGDYDHEAHLTNDRESQMKELERYDAMLGRIWATIRETPEAARTLVVMLSDHGMNSVQGTYSQGYSLVDFLRSAKGGGHHTMTDRHPMQEFKVRGIYPLVSQVITPSSESAYLKGESDQYPTALLDVDGNERAAVQFRNSDLNALHILLKQIARKDLPVQTRQAAEATFYDILDSHRDAWQRRYDGLQVELVGLRAEIAKAGPKVKRKWTEAEIEDGENQPARRQAAQLLTWQQDEHSYSEYLGTMSKLLGLKRGQADLQHVKIDELIPKRSLGEENSIYDLQNYVVGPSREGLILARNDNARLDIQESFARVNYFAAFTAITVRNNVQSTVGNRPVDFVAARTPDGIFLYRDAEHEALIQGRKNGAGQLELRYVPVSGLHGVSDGTVAWSASEWKEGLPLSPSPDWPGAWRPDREWLKLTYDSRYTDGVIGIHEQFVEPEPLSGVSPVMKQYEWRRRKLVTPDLALLANDHWNFNVRSFNPGGNHGSFFGISTHSLLMMASGSEIGVPEGKVVEEPYDTLSEAPTVLKLMGFDVSGMPGPLIKEVIPSGNGGSNVSRVGP